MADVTTETTTDTAPTVTTAEPSGVLICVRRRSRCERNCADWDWSFPALTAPPNLGATISVACSPRSTIPARPSR